MLHIRYVSPTDTERDVRLDADDAFARASAAAEVAEAVEAQLEVAEDLFEKIAETLASERARYEAFSVVQEVRGLEAPDAPEEAAAGSAGQEVVMAEVGEAPPFIEGALLATFAGICAHDCDAETLVDYEDDPEDLAEVAAASKPKEPSPARDGDEDEDLMMPAPLRLTPPPPPPPLPVPPPRRAEPPVVAVPDHSPPYWMQVSSMPSHYPRETQRLFFEYGPFLYNVRSSSFSALSAQLTGQG